MSAPTAEESRGSLPPAAAAAAASADSGVDPAVIDRSTRWPVLLFLASAVTWLLVSSSLATIAAIKLHWPDFLASYGFLTYGRVQPASVDAFLYGWMMNAGMGIGLWMTARLCRVAVAHAGLVIVAAAVWNLGVTLGVFGILGGNNTSVEWLEFPNFASPVLFIGYAFAAVWVVLMFQLRRPGHVYISQWYLLAAFLWFPWVYGTANLFINFLPIQPSAQNPVNWWYVHNFYGLWQTPVALAACYYFIPKVTGRPIHNYPLAFLGFWALAAVFGWNGMQHLIDGPIPAWMVSISVVASLLMIVPLIVVANNLLGTMRGQYAAVSWSPTIRFVTIGLFCFLAVSGEGILLAVRSINRVVHFTQFTVAHGTLGTYGFFSLVLFGAIYYVVPRLVGWNWASTRLIRWHFWLSVWGLGLLFLDLSVGGVFQGYGLSDKAVPLIAVVNLLVPFFVVKTGATLLLSAAHVVFAASFLLLVARTGRPVPAGGAGAGSAPGTRPAADAALPDGPADGSALVPAGAGAAGHRETTAA